MNASRPKSLVVAVGVLVGLLALSGLRPYDQATWLMEVFPVLLALPVLCGTAARFPLTPLVACRA